MTVALSAQLAASQASATAETRYHALLRGSVSCGGTTSDFHDLNLAGLWLPGCLNVANLSGANLSGAKFRGTFIFANLTNADLTNADLSNATLIGADPTGATITGVIWSLNTQCPDATYAGSNGTSPSSCIGHGF